LNVGAPRDQHRILKQIIGRAIFLEDDDNVLNFSRWRRRYEVRAAGSGAAIQTDQKRREAGQQAPQYQHFKANHWGNLLAR
jgi:hypothetical protein